MPPMAPGHHGHHGGTFDEGRVAAVDFQRSRWPLPMGCLGAVVNGGVKFESVVKGAKCRFMESFVEGC